MSTLSQTQIQTQIQQNLSSLLLHIDDPDAEEAITLVAQELENSPESEWGEVLFDIAFSVEVSGKLTVSDKLKLRMLSRTLKS